MHTHVHDNHVQCIYWYIMWTSTYVYMCEREADKGGIYNKRVDARKGAHIWGNPTNMVNNAMARTVKFEIHTMDSLHEYKPSPSLLAECSHKPSYVVLQTPEQRPRALSGQLDHIQTLQRSAYQLLGRGSPLTPVGNLHNPRSLLTEPLSRGAEVAKGKNK